jgi:hypothetical protein
MNGFYQRWLHHGLHFNFLHVHYNNVVVLYDLNRRLAGKLGHVAIICLSHTNVCNSLFVLRTQSQALHNLQYNSRITYVFSNRGICMQDWQEVDRVMPIVKANCYGCVPIHIENQCCPRPLHPHPWEEHQRLSLENQFALGNGNLEGFNILPLGRGHPVKMQSISCQSK